jgi:hypothetical protein
MKSLFDTLNIVHDERDFLKLNAISLSFTVGGRGARMADTIGNPYGGWHDMARYP